MSFTTKSILSELLILPIRFYRLCISPLFPGSCRFTPTCSQYAIDALREHGPLKGLYLAGRRILRCHPWGGSGYDPVPPRVAARYDVIDIHTHSCRDGAIISVSPYEYESMRGGDRLFSVGIHPWHSADDDCDAQLAMLEEIARRPDVVAIGECGLDRLRGATPQVQEELFRRQIRISREVGKPLIIHLVKETDLFLRIIREEKPTQPIIIHGYRGNPAQASQLTAFSPLIHFSLGEKFNPETAAMLPADRMLAETDESNLPLPEITARIAAARAEAPEALARTLRANTLRLFPTLSDRLAAG